MKTFRVLIVACALICFGAAAAFAEPIGRPDTPPLLKKVDSFAFVVDTSGSMMMTSTDANESKVVLAKRLAGLINDRIPSLDYNAGLYTVCPAATPVQAGKWDRLALGNAVSELPSNLAVFGRMTPLGTDVSKLQPAIGNLRNGALILMSDGNQNLGPDAVASFRSVLQATGVKLYIVSFADTPEGKKVLDQLATLSSNPVVSGKSLTFNPTALDAFVKQVFYTEGQSVIADCSVYFDTAKYNLKPDAISTLDQALVSMLNTPRGVRTIQIEGYADAQGGMSVSNKILSGRRAAAVQQYIESKGVPAAKIYARGNNVSYKANNATKQGRHDNRRVDLIIN